MASLNKKKSIYTHEGAKARYIQPKAQLERSVMSCLLWEDGFYEDGKLISSRIQSLCMRLDASDILEVALKAKNDMRLRHVPLFLVREAFKHKGSRKHCGDVLEQLITRPDDITEFLALYWKNGKEPLAKQAKLALGRAFHKFDEYQLAKYNGGRKEISLVDALRVVHPEPSELLGKLRNGTLFTPVTWEVELSKGGDKKEIWERLLKDDRLGGLALLRNIRNMAEAGVDGFLIKEAIRNIKTGRLLPINFISSGMINPSFEAEIEEVFLKSFSKDKHGGRTVLLIDVSYSMFERLSSRSILRRADVAASLAMIARETFADITVFSFSDNLVLLPSRRGFALRDLLNAQMHNNTYLGASISYIKNNVSHDRLIVITDEQSHDTVPDFDGYLINVASNRNGVGYGKCVHIDGWSDKVIDYILQYENQK